MGLIISESGNVIWEPSQAVGRLFLDQVTSLERLVGLPSGVGAVVADEVEIQPEVYHRFVSGLITYLSETHNGPLRAMTEGVVQVVLALYERVFGHYPPVPETLRAIVADAGRAMEAPTDTRPVPASNGPKRRTGEGPERKIRL